MYNAKSGAILLHSLYIDKCISLDYLCYEITNEIMQRKIDDTP